MTLFIQFFLIHLFAGISKYLKEIAEMIMVIMIASMNTESLGADIPNRK